MGQISTVAMKLRVIGASGTYPEVGRPAASFLVTQDDVRVLCDAGPGTLTSLPIHVDMLDGVVISHQHPDHCSDVLTLFHALTYRPDPPDPIPLLAPQSVWDRLVAFLDKDIECFAFQAVSEGDQVSLGDIRVSFATMNHSVPTVGSRWEANNRSFFYTGDTGPSGSWKEAAENVNLLVCEASYQDATEDASYPQHMSARAAGKIAREVGAEALMLTHIPPHLDKSVSVAEAEAEFGKTVRLAVPGADFSV